MKPKYILAQRLTEKMAAQGLLPPGVTRVVIDLQVDQPIKVYFECLGDDRLLDVLIPENMLVVKQPAINDAA